MKVIFGGETKRIPEIKDYVELLKYAASVFDATHLQAKATDLKLFYQDDEGDIISVTCQSDLEEAYRIMTGRIKFVFSLDEETARKQLVKGQPTQQHNDSFFRSEYIRPNQVPSLLDRSTISQINSDLGPCPISARNMPMGLMFEAYLQNQIECTMRQRGMSGTSMFDFVAQAHSSKLQIEGGPLDEQPVPIEVIEEITHDEKPSNVELDQNIDQIVNEYDDEPPESSSDAAAQHCLEEPPKPETEIVETREDELPVAPPVETTMCKPAPKRCCLEGDFCFKCILNKVKLSLEPFFEPSYQATCLDQPTDFIGVAGADFSATCKFKNTGKSAWPANVQLRLVNGTTVVYNALGEEAQSVGPDEELNVTIELKLPIAAGRYTLQFRLVHGDNVEFGDEVTVNLVAQAAEPAPRQCCPCPSECACPSGCATCDSLSVSTMPTTVVKPTADDHRLVSALEEPLNETNGDTFYVDQDDEEEDGSDGELDLSVNSWTVVDYAEPAAEAPAGPDPKEEIEEPPMASAPTVLATLTEEEVRRNFYNKQVYMTRYDQKYRENLVALMKAGCLDFDRNLQALRRNGNKFDPGDTEVLRQIE